MKIDKKKVRQMKEIMTVLSVSDRELTPKGQQRLQELSSYFLYIAVAGKYAKISS